MIEMPKIRERIRDAVWHLHVVDDRLAELAESLMLPLDAGEMRHAASPAPQEAATIAGARYHGLDRQVGSIEPGKLADLVVLEENSLTDIYGTRSIRFVMKHGVLYSGDDLARIYPDPREGERMYFQVER